MRFLISNSSRTLCTKDGVFVNACKYDEYLDTNVDKPDQEFFDDADVDGVWLWERQCQGEGDAEVCENAWVWYRDHINQYGICITSPPGSIPIKSETMAPVRRNVHRADGTRLNSRNILYKNNIGYEPIRCDENEYVNEHSVTCHPVLNPGR